MSTTHSKNVDRITDLLHPAEKAGCSFCALIQGMEAVAAGKKTIEAFRNEAILEAECSASKLNPGVRSAYLVETYRLFSDHWLMKYLEEMHETRVWKIRWISQALGLQKMIVAASGGSPEPEDRFAILLRKEAYNLQAIRESELWQDTGKAPPPLPDDIGLIFVECLGTADVNTSPAGADR